MVWVANDGEGLVGVEVGKTVMGGWSVGFVIVGNDEYFVVEEEGEERWLSGVCDERCVAARSRNMNVKFLIAILPT